MSKKDRKPRPFFAKFLEGVDEEEQDRLIAGGPPTRKYPSDKDELFETAFSSSEKRVTYKYPSDKDELWDHTEA